MIKHDDNKGFPITKWEQSIQGRPEIEFEEFKLHRGLVCGAVGFIKANNKRYPVKWLFNGVCFFRGKRAKQYDITF